MEQIISLSRVVLEHIGREKNIPEVLLYLRYGAVIQVHFLLFILDSLSNGIDLVENFRKYLVGERTATQLKTDYREQYVI